jgi:hypothetical protein
LINKYILLALLAISIVLASYFAQFYYFLNYEISDKPETWGQLGDYVGGLLNPVLSFLSLLLLIKSLSIQNEANQSLMVDLKNKERTEKLRSFETLFFNMIESQKHLFNSFEVELIIDGELQQKSNVDAVLALEEEICRLRSNSANDEQIVQFLVEADPKDKLFGLVRVFYIIVKIISEKLSDNLGFNTTDRIEYLNTLINFTEFSQLILIKICIQFMNYPSINYLRQNKEFNDTMDQVGLNSTNY